MRGISSIFPHPVRLRWGVLPAEPQGKLKIGFPLIIDLQNSILAWKIPWTEEPGGLQSMGSQRVRHDRATSLSLSPHFYLSSNYVGTRCMKPPSLLFLKIALAIWCLLWFYTNFIKVFSISVRNTIGIVIGLHWLCRLLWVVWTF